MKKKKNIFTHMQNTYFSQPLVIALSYAPTAKRLSKLNTICGILPSAIIFCSSKIKPFLAYARMKKNHLLVKVYYSQKGPT